MVGMTPRIWEDYTDYFLGKRVMLLENCAADGTKHLLGPPWAIILSYELECRKSALLRVAEKGLTFVAALSEVIRDPELKELAFTSPIAHLGRGSSSSSTSALKPAARTIVKSTQHLIDNPNWPLKKSGTPTQGRGKGKAKGAKGGGKGKGKAGKQKQAFATPDGQHICFAFNSPAGCSDPNCSRLHVCRNWGCYGQHAASVCPTAPTGNGP